MQMQLGIYTMFISLPGLGFLALQAMSSASIRIMLLQSEDTLDIIALSNIDHILSHLQARAKLPKRLVNYRLICDLGQRSHQT